MAEDRRDEEPVELSDEIVRRWDPDRILRLVSKRAGKGQRLDLATREYFERRLGVDLGDVRVYTGEFAEEVTRARGAEAITVGTTGMILMRGSAERSMDTSGGRALLAHELTHVAQEQRGMHRRATFGEPTPLATEEHEVEAEAAEAAEQTRGPAPSGPDPMQERAKREDVAAELKRRVFDKLAEAERVWLMRNGEEPWRP